MEGKKKTATPVEEQPQAVETVQEPAQPEMAPQESEDNRMGLDLADSALDSISEKIVVVHSILGLNLRSGPGLGYPIADVLEDGTLLAVLGLPYSAEVPGWALVHTGQRTGWVDCGFIQALEHAHGE